MRRGSRFLSVSHARAARSAGATLALLGAVAVSVVASDGARAEAPAAPPPAAPAPVEPAPTPPPQDPLAVPRDLVESAPNSKDNLQRAIALYDEALKDSSLPAAARANAWADASRAWLRLGDLQGTEAEKIRCYDAGRAAAKKGLAVDANHVESLFWDMANLATTGRTRGVMNSLFMLAELRRGLKRALELDKNHLLAKQTLAEIDHAVPGIAGGSDERAEKAYLEILQRDPALTSTMVNLAKMYRDQGKKEEARKLAQQAIDTTSPSNRNDWKKFDKRDAKQLLEELAK